MNPFEAWILGWGSAVGERIDAAEALRSEPSQLGPEGELLLPTAISSSPALLDAYQGRIRLLAGDAARALPLLNAAAQSCVGIDRPFLVTREQLWLGMAYEKLGRRREACEAYAVVTRRWGRSEPRSITATEAMKRSRALGCSG